MSAQMLQFPDWIQEPLEQGVLTPEQAWRLEWELTQLSTQPWSPGMFELNLKVRLYHLPKESILERAPMQ
jgi:hypothetical protein